MNRTHLTVSVWTVALVLFIFAASWPMEGKAAAANEGLTIQSKRVVPPMMGQPGRTEVHTTYFAGNTFRDSSENDDSIVLFDQRRLIRIDPKKKTYAEGTFDEVQEMLNNLLGKMGAQQAQATQAMRQMMGEPGQVTVSAQGAGEEVAGYATQKYLLKMPPMMEMEIWAAPDLEIPAVYYDAVRLRTPPNPMFDMGKLMEEMKKIQGLHVKSVNTMSMMGMTMKITHEVTSIQRGPIPPSTFEVPAGYQKVEMTDFLMR